MLATLLFRAWHYLKHRWRCLNQEPAYPAYQFFKHCVQPAARLPHGFPLVEAFRQKLEKSPDSISFTHPKTQEHHKVALSRQARKTSSSPRFNQMLAHLCQWLKVQCALETGTSLGLSAFALAQASTVQSVITLEGAAEIAQKARILLQEQKNISVYSGLLRQKLPELLQQFEPQLIFLDADHRSSEVLFCLEQINKHAAQVKAVVIHDIYWSRDMYQGWRTAKKCYPQALALDLYECGILLFSPSTPAKSRQEVSFCWP